MDNDDSLARLLCENLLHYGRTPHVLEQWKTELMRSHCTNYNAVVERALSLVQEEEEEKCRPNGSSKKQQATASSLFSNNAFFFQGNLSYLITLDQIEEATSQEDRLELFKSAVVDDLLPDWPSVARLLQQGLMDNRAYLQVYEKLLNDTIGKVSNEYLIVKMDVCEHLIDYWYAAETTRTSSKNDEDDSSCCLGLVAKVWMDWMINDAYQSEKRAFALGKKLYRLHWNSDSSPSQLAMYFAENDPQGRWFRAWVHHLTPQQGVELAACMMDTIDGSLMNRQSEEPKVHDRYWLALVASLLVKTRVSLFPWSSLDCGRDVAIQTLVGKLLGALSNGTTSSRTVYVEAVDSILWGCHADKELFRLVAEKVKSCPDDPVQALLLQFRD